MRFSSKYGHARYTVIPKDYELVGHHKKILPGSLAAEFTNHTFDSEKAQKVNRWTDEQRQDVEEYLTDHVAFGHEFWATEQLTEGVNFSGQKCLFVVPMPDGTLDVCGMQAEVDSEYCSKHGTEVAAAPTKRRKQEVS